MLGRRGFTLVEVVVTLFILALVAGVVVPQIMARTREGEAASLIRNLTAITDGANAYRADLGRYPPQLTLLTSPPSPGSHDLCGITLPDVTPWRGPYLNRSVTTAGIGTGTSTISNTVSRDPPSAVITTAFGTLVVTATDVDQEIAILVSTQFDGNTALDSGSVRWVVGSVAGRGTLTYRIPIRGC